MQKFILFLCLMSLSMAMICHNNSQIQCQIPECIWTNNTCLQSKGLCSPGTFGFNSTDSCQPCSVLTKNNCSLFCPSYYYNSNASSCTTCQILDYNCISCTESACLQCYSGFQPSTIFPTQCVPTPCLILNCLLCGPNGTCSLCKSYSNNSSFFNNTSFLNFTSNSSFMNFTSNSSHLLPTTCGPTCQIVNCLICYSPSSCTVCNSNYYLSNDSTTCVLSCNAANCLTCQTFSTCLVCISGYFLNLNTLECDLQCLVSNCLMCSSSTTCEVCITGYQPSSTYNYCSFICSVQFCTQCSNDSLCIQCQTGFQLEENGTSCLPAICFIQNCLLCNTSSTCSQCNNISQLGVDDTQCIEICLSTIPNCQTCLNTINCLACNVGYALSPMNTVCTAICSIPSCFICKTSTSCLFCEANYLLSTDEQSCNANCGITNCQNCAGLTTCQNCLIGYVLMDSGVNCFPPCSPGSYLSTTNDTSTCQLCSLSADFCLTCAVSTNTTVVCSQCIDGYVLDFEFCRPCSQTLANCLSCSNIVLCNECDQGYTTLAFGGVVACAQIVSCQVSNCKICSKDNSTQCLFCFIQYQISNNGSSCTLIMCPSTQYYDALVKSCVCPIGTYLSNNVCQYCSITNCLACNDVGCTSCFSGFYPALGGCASCSSNCIQCNSNSSCISCDYGYSLQNGICAYTTLGSSVQVNAATIPCPPGCSQCAYSNDVVYCIFASAAYHFNPAGVIQPCNSNCLTCSTTNHNICTSCFGFSYLAGGQCLGCADEFAITCPSNSNYSTSCIRGYSPFNGKCLVCSAFCMSCGNSGAGMCDSNGCQQGFVLLQGTNNCTMCFSGCSVCSSVDPSQCISCSGNNYLNNISVCALCPLECLTCTSDIVCTSCISNYFLSNTFCYLQIGFPCSKQDQSKSNCTECFYGYSFVNGICLLDLSCNSTSTCYSCPKYYYLSHKNCYKCTTNVFCDFCNPSNSSICLTCAEGFYLSNGSCVQCNQAQSGCIQCSSPSLCTQASTGFYLDTDAGGFYTGRVNQCGPNCATCSKAYSCDTCGSQYTRFGVFCIDRLSIRGTLTLAPGSDSSWFNNNNSDNVNLARALLHCNEIAMAIAQSAGYSNLDNTFLTGMSNGSVIVDFIVGVNSQTDASTFADNFQKKASAGITGFTVVSLTTTSNGFSSQSNSDSSKDLGLILGLSIPLGLLFIILIIVIVLWRVEKKQHGQVPAEFSREETKL